MLLLLLFVCQVKNGMNPSRAAAAVSNLMTTTAMIILICVTSLWKWLHAADLLQAFTEHIDYNDPVFATATYIRLQVGSITMLNAR